MVPLNAGGSATVACSDYTSNAGTSFYDGGITATLISSATGDAPPDEPGPPRPPCAAQAPLALSGFGGPATGQARRSGAGLRHDRQRLAYITPSRGDVPLAGRWDAA